MTTSEHCRDHVEAERARAKLEVQLNQARSAHLSSARAVERIDARLREVERKMSIWLGVIACLAAIPVVEKVAGILIPAARAAIGQ